MVIEFEVNKASILFSVVLHCFQALLLLTFLLFAYQKNFVLDEHDESFEFSEAISLVNISKYQMEPRAEMSH